MENPEKRLEINHSALPETIAAALRYAIALILPWLVARGYIDESSTEGVASIVLVIATVVYGLYRTFRNKKDLVKTAEAAPNSVAVVK